MKIFKTVGCFLYQYFEEAIAIFLLSIQFAQLTLGLYEESMQGFAFTFMFITAVFHQRDAQKSQKAYVELWYKISACTQAAKEKNILCAKCCASMSCRNNTPLAIDSANSTAPAHNI